MPDQLQLRGGTTTEHNSFTGVSREVTVDTTKKTLVVHDGSTAGGTPLMREGGSNGQSTVGIGTGGSNAIEISNGQDIKFIGADNNKHFLFDKSTGNIGVGTINPSEKIHAVTVGGANNSIRLDTNQNATRIKAKVVGGENHLVLSSNNDAESVVITGSKVGIGTSSPGALLHTESTDPTIRIKRSDGNAYGEITVDTAGLFSLKSDPSQQSNNNGFIFTIDNSERVRVKSDGDIQLSRTTAGSGATETFLLSGNYGSGGDQALQASNALRFYTNGANERVRITSTGNVGIGTTSPSEKLDVNGNITASGKITAYDATSASNQVKARIRASAADDTARVGAYFGDTELVALFGKWTGSAFSTGLNIPYEPFTVTGTGGATRITINAAGYVGINTGHVEAPLSVNRDITAASSLNLNHQTMMLRNSGSADAACRTSLYFRTHAADNKLSPSAIRCISDVNFKSILAFHVNGNGNGTGHLEGYERMRINGDGQIGINTTAPTQTLDVNGVGRFRQHLMVDGATGQHNGSSLYVVGSYGDSGSQTCARFTNSDGSQLLLLRNDKAFYSDSIYHGTTSSAANVAVNSSGYVARSTSSRDYKKNIKDALWGLAEVLKLRPVTFQNNAVGEFADDHTYGGFISEELDESGLTEFVQYDENNKAEGISYGHMVALLTNAIKELSAKVTALETAAA